MSKLGRKFCISMSSVPEKNTMRGDEEITIEDFTRPGDTPRVML